MLVRRQISLDLQKFQNSFSAENRVQTAHLKI